MMDIRIKRMVLENFKCFRHKEIVLSDDVTVIKGRNGVGKTTIADAVLWCLFGKNTQGQSDFSIKTMEDGVEIPHLDHSVELILSVNGEEQSLKRTLKETWVKKRGSDEQVFKNNTTEYVVNGDVLTATDYKKAVNGLAPEDIFRIVTNPLYFPSLKWQEQREFLSTLADGEIDFSDNEDLLELQRKLEQNKEDIVAYKKHLSYRIKEVKEKLKQIPVRLEEQHKALPEKLDWEALQKDYDEIMELCKQKSGEILSIKQGNGGEIERERIRQELRKVQNDIDRIEEKATRCVREARAELDSKINQARSKFSEITRNKADMDSKILSYDSLLRRCNETLERCNEDADEIRRLWSENNKRFDTSEIQTTCPTCGQTLPDYQLQELIENMRTNFNRNQEKVKKQLREKAEVTKKLIADTEKEIESLNNQKAEDLETALRLKNELNEQHKEIVELERTPLETFEDYLIGDEEYSTLLKQKTELSKQMETAGMSDKENDNLLKLEAEYLELQKKNDLITSQLVSRVHYDRIQGLIDGIKKDEKELVSTLSELEKAEDIARMYQRIQNNIIESRINEHFELVKWKLFKVINNAGDPIEEPYCECYVNGVAYHDGLNQAARLNAGLDIVRTLCKHYGLTAPIVIDNSESNLNILETESQQIRLEVCDTDLTIK